MRLQFQHALEGMEILRQVAAAARFNHDAAAGNHQVAAEQRAGRVVPEREVVGRVAGGVDRRDRVAAESNVIAVGQRLQSQPRRRDVVSPWELGEDSARKNSGERRNTGGVVADGCV